MSVAVPVQRFRAVRGALLLSTQGGDINQAVEAERLQIVKLFLILLGVMVVLSMLLAGTIAGPVRRLAEGAERVRHRIRSRVEIPDLTGRRDEIGHLSGALRDMTSALYSRIEAIESFAADVAHELKNPLTSLRSAVETLPLARTPESRQRLLAVIQHDVKRLDRLISDISDASRLDAELQRDEMAPVDLAKLLEHRGDGAERDRADRHRRRLADLRGRRPARLRGARTRFPSRPGGRQSDRQRALVRAGRQHRARHLPAAARRGRDRRRRRRAGHPRRTPSTRFSSASTPTGRTRASARTPGSGCRSPSRSSRRIAAGCGRRTALGVAGADGEAPKVLGARFVVRLPRV